MKRYLIVKSADNTYAFDMDKKKGYKESNGEIIEMKIKDVAIFTKIICYVDSCFESDELPFEINK